LRVAARRPRRVVLGVVSIAIAVSGIFNALVLNTYLTTQRLAGGLGDAQAELLSEVLLVVMVMVLSLAAVNAIFITWATVLDNRHSSALARALGATPREASFALAAAQVLPALTAPSWASSRAASHCSPPSTRSPAVMPTEPRFRRSGSCSPWCWRPCSWWRPSPPSPPGLAAAVPWPRLSKPNGLDAQIEGRRLVPPVSPPLVAP
jgi:hypothetical protein